RWSLLASGGRRTIACSPVAPRNRGTMVMIALRRYARAAAASLILASPVLLAAQKNDKADKSKDNPDARRPKMTLKAQPVIGIAPARVVLTAELVGGANDYEDFYCPTIEWEWGDGTRSESSADCAP